MSSSLSICEKEEDQSVSSSAKETIFRSRLDEVPPWDPAPKRKRGLRKGWGLSKRRSVEGVTDPKAGTTSRTELKRFPRK